MAVLTDLITDSLALNAGQEWSDVALFTPYLHDQALLYEYADCLAAQTFLRIAQLPFAVKQRPNAEFISPTGRVPMLKIQKTLIPGFSDIVDFVSKKGISLTSHLSDTQVAEMKAYMAMIDHSLRRVELYILWKHDETYNQVTKYRYSSVYHWPISWILPKLKRREILTHLDDVEWADKTMENIVEQCDKVFRALSSQLGNSPYLMGDHPTEADALLFGHLYSIVTIRLPAMDVANTLKKYGNLVEFTQRIESEFFKQ